jgi:hypothetical protein
MATIEQKAVWVKALYQQGLKHPAWSKERGEFHTESFWLFSNWFRPMPDPYQPFHHEWMRIACSEQFFCVLAPRDHSKSSTFGSNYPIWRLFMDPNSTIMLVASAASVAETQMRVIKTVIETDQLLSELFSKLYPENPSKWTNTEIIVNREETSAHASVVSLGVGSAILSRRAKYIIADDIVRDDEIQVESQRDRLRTWVNGVLIGVAEAEDQIGFIGTAKHNADYYTELEANPKYSYHRYDAIVKENENGTWETLWPSKWPEKALRTRLALIGSYEFNRNYRNIAMGENDSPFPEQWLERCKNYNLSITWTYPYPDVRKAIGIDLSSGTHGSYFVAMVVGLLPNGRYVILNMIRRNDLDFPHQIAEVSTLIENYLPECVVVESNAYQSAMYDTLVLKYPNVNVEPHFTGRNKHDPTEGLPMLQPIIESGRMNFPYQDPSACAMSDIIINELHRVKVARYTDTVMALWFAVKWLSQFARIENQARALVI